jgi:hypothetical protein
MATVAVLISLRWEWWKGILCNIYIPLWSQSSFVASNADQPTNKCFVVLGYRSGGPGSIPGITKKIVVLEQGPLSFMSTTEELLDRKVAAPV